MIKYSRRFPSPPELLLTLWISLSLCLYSMWNKLLWRLLCMGWYLDFSINISQQWHPVILELSDSEYIVVKILNPFIENVCPYPTLTTSTWLLTYWSLPHPNVSIPNWLILTWHLIAIKAWLSAYIFKDCLNGLRKNNYQKCIKIIIKRPDNQSLIQSTCLKGGHNFIW